MKNSTPKGKLSLRLWSHDVSLGELAKETGFNIEHVHPKGGPVRLANGQISASNATRHYLAFTNVDVSEPPEANRHIKDILTSLRKTTLAGLIASGAVEAAIDLAAFHGEVDWEGRIDGSLLEAAHAAKVQIVVVRYDKFTEQGEPRVFKL